MEIKKGDLITSAFTIKKIEGKKNRAELILENKDQQFKGILKDNLDLFLRSYNENDHVLCKAKVRKRKEETILEIIYIKKYEDSEKKELQKEEFKDSEIEQMIKRFDNLINSVEDKEYKSILEEFFLNEEIRNMFFIAPAAKNNHHNYPYGLLQHSIEVAELSKIIAEYFSCKNIDLLITGALLHDIGKIKSYEYKNNEILKTNWEHLLGHLSISAIFISKMMPDDMPTDKAMVLYHLILSHHGKLEYGSPVEGKMREAEILHDADLTSCKMNHIENLDYSATNWSKIDNKTKKSWFKGNV